MEATDKYLVRELAPGAIACVTERGLVSPFSNRKVLLFASPSFFSIEPAWHFLVWEWKAFEFFLFLVIRKILVLMS